MDPDKSLNSLWFREVSRFCDSPIPRTTRKCARVAYPPARAGGQKRSRAQKLIVRHIKACLCPFLYLAMILFSLGGLSCGRSGDQKQRQVVLYCSVDQTIAEPIIARFEKQTGIKVLARFDTESSKTVGLVQRLRAEAQSPLADVFWSSEVFYTIRLAREGLLARYDGEETRDWPEQLADREGRWYGFALRARVIAYSTDRVSSDEAPKCLEDLLDGKWKGRLVMASPEFGTTGGDIASWFAHYGEQRTRVILAGLKTNDIRLVQGNSSAVRWVATGRADVCLTDTDDVYAAQRNGWGVAMNYLNQNNKGVLAIPNTAAIIRGAPHIEEARELMGFLLSDKVETMLAESDSHNTPIHASLSGRFGKYAIPNPLDIAYEEVADNLPKAIKLSREILR